MRTNSRHLTSSSRRRHYEYQHNYGVSGSSALEYGSAEVIPTHRRYPKRIKKKRYEIITIYRKVREEKHLQAICYAITFTLIFCISLLTYLYYSSATYHKTKELSNLKNTLQTIEEKNVYYETEISKSIDLELVEKTAKLRLGMSEPASHQKKYINVPKQSYTTQNKE